MKAAYIKATGPAENIIYGDLPVPSPVDSQVLVRVEAVDVNPIDTYLRSGMVAMPLPIPYIVGCDAAGVVESVGPKVTQFRPGDRVWASNQGQFGRQGTFAEFALIDEPWLHHTPEGVDSRTAAAISLVGLTAGVGLLQLAKLTAGETLFVNGGSGGVGSMVVQMGKALGARVITTAGSDEKVRLCRELGADLAINYKTEDVDARIKEFSPKGVNLWWETLREPDFERTIGLLAQRGRMILMAGREAKVPFPVGPFYVKGCSLFGLALFNAKPDEQRAVAERINAWLAEGKLKANIDRVMPLAETAAAHKLQEGNTLHKSGTLAGKIVLVP